jgi:hypothetical protein
MNREKFVQTFPLRRYNEATAVEKPIKMIVDGPQNLTAKHFVLRNTFSAARLDEA